MLSPQWLFAKGIANVWGGRAIEVPYFNAQRPKSTADIVALLDRHIDERSRAIYFNTPNNPTGMALSTWEVKAIGDYARSRNMTIVADNAYEAFDFSREDFPDPAAAEMFPESTIGLYSFSKTFGWTGFRIGYAVMPASLAHAFRTLALHSIYCVSTASQIAALQGLKDFDATIDRHGDWVRANLGLVRRDCRIPKSDCVGGFYTLLDLSDYPGGAMRFIDAALDRGISLAPGSAFGLDCEERLRLCHAVIEEERLGQALKYLNEIYESG
jgi:aspartate/methionine/tyrosine aminotransferase|tara:strand:+ start:1297 stop:2106 length:810 start_codon:yes stop_codon:yes gene_type:complete